MRVEDTAESPRNKRSGVEVGEEPLIVLAANIVDNCFFALLAADSLLLFQTLVAMLASTETVAITKKISDLNPRENIPLGLTQVANDLGAFLDFVLRATAIMVAIYIFVRAALWFLGGKQRAWYVPSSEFARIVHVFLLIMLALMAIVGLQFFLLGMNFNDYKLNIDASRRVEPPFWFPAASTLVTILNFVIPLGFLFALGYCIYSVSSFFTELIDRREESERLVGTTRFRIRQGDRPPPVVILQYWAILLGSVVVLVISVIALIFLARSIGPEQLGKLFSWFFLGFLGFVVCATVWLLVQTTEYESASDRKWLLRTIVGVPTGCAVLLALPVLIYGPPPAPQPANRKPSLPDPSSAMKERISSRVRQLTEADQENREQAARTLDALDPGWTTGDTARSDATAWLNELTEETKDATRLEVLREALARLDRAIVVPKLLSHFPSSSRVRNDLVHLLNQVDPDWTEQPETHTLVAQLVAKRLPLGKPYGEYQGLAILGRAAASAIPALAKDLDDGNPAVRVAAARALETIDPSGEASGGRSKRITSLVQGIAAEPPWGSIATEILEESVPDWRSRPEISSALTKLLQRFRTDPERPDYIASLEQIDPNWRERPETTALVRDSIKALESLHADPPSQLIVVALGKIGTNASEAIPALMVPLSSNNWPLRDATRKSLQAIDPAWQTHPVIKRSLDDLQARLQNPDPKIRLEAIQKLDPLGDLAMFAVPSLFEEMFRPDRNETVGFDASLLEKLAPKFNSRPDGTAIVELLVGALSDENKARRTLAAHLLAKAHAEPGLATAAMVNLLAEDPDISGGPLSVLREIDPAWARRPESVSAVPALLEAAKDLERKGQIKPTYQLYRRILDICPNSAPLHVALAEFELRTESPDIGSSQTAHSEAQEAVKLDPKLLSAQRALGASSLRALGPKQAIDAFQAALEIDPHDMLSLHGMGQALNMNGDSEAAITRSHQVVEETPDFAPARADLAVSLFLLGRYPEALQELRKASELQPDFAMLGHQYALFLLHQGDAAGYQEQCIRMQERFLSSDDPEVIGTLALTLSAARESVAEWGPIVQKAKWALETKGFSRPIRRALATAYLRNGQYDEAYALFKSFEADGNERVLHNQIRGLILARAGNRASANRFLSEDKNQGYDVCSPRPGPALGNVFQRLWWEWLEYRIRRQELARLGYMDWTKEFRPDVDNSQLAREQMRSGHLESAERLYRDLLTRVPKNAELRAELASVLLGLKRPRRPEKRPRPRSASIPRWPRRRIALAPAA